ncbi:hypothetical protein BG000_009465 [Podila horticola]|nr:hypothetical protein BG000_009465 [Podila horticola]
MASPSFSSSQRPPPPLKSPPSEVFGKVSDYPDRRDRCSSVRVSHAAPIPAPGNDPNFGGGVNAVNNLNFSAADVCLQELATVPIGASYIGKNINACTNGNVADHSGN